MMTIIMSVVVHQFLLVNSKQEMTTCRRDRYIYDCVCECVFVSSLLTCDFSAVARVYPDQHAAHASSEQARAPREDPGADEEASLCRSSQTRLLQGSQCVAMP